MGKPSKRNREIAKLVDKDKTYGLKEAIDTLKSCPPVKFDQSINISLSIGADPRRSDQLVRGTVSLPNGTGKKMRVLVFAKGEKAEEALKAGADYAGHEELLTKVNGGWTDFDAVITTPDLMRDVGKLGKVLGPRGLMPTPRAGTVTNDIEKAVTEVKGGKIEFKLDKHAIINNMLGKLSFAAEQLDQNIRSFIDAVLKAKPAAAKGKYMKSAYLSSTMGPGLRLDLRDLMNEE
ncbi:MAG: 50S ribosomal protein L1 [Chlamydiia bacterium]|nr:50S ribosomal protein L1 [Chlamydiia bacterium]